jgi:hypothetical protein
MSRSNKHLSVPAAITVVAVGVIALIASGALRPSPVSGTPPRDVSWVPSVPPAPAAPVEPVPTSEPVDDLGDGGKTVKLDIATPHVVFAHVKDFTGGVVDAKTGRAGDGMSVRWFELKVENRDDDTLRLTWVGSPTDDPVKVIVANIDGDASDRPTIAVMQLMPPPNSDAIGFDRVLDLDFGSPVSADDFETLIQEGYDTDD